MAIKAVLFDMDGVLLDSEPFHQLADLEVLRGLGIKADQTMLDPYCGRTSTMLWNDMRRQFSLEPTVEELDEIVWDWRVRNLRVHQPAPSRGLDVLLTYLRKNKIRAAVASSSQRAFVEAVIDYLGIGNSLEGFTSGEEAQRSKPAPDIFLLAAKKLGVEPGECLVVEDSSAGVRAGKAAGMFTVGYDNPTSVGQDISPADVTVSDLAEIPAIIASLN